MNCHNCGTYNNTNGSFCINCGAQLYNQINTQPNQMNTQPNQMNPNQVGQLTIIREKSFFGMAIAFKLYVDGVFIDKIANGETKTFPIYYGTHRIEIKQHMNYGMKDILVNEYQNNIVLNCHLKFGILTNSIEII